MPKQPRHMVMICPVANLDCSSRIIHMANAFSESGTKVSLVCPQQRSDNAQELRKLLHESTSVYIALGSPGRILHIRHVSGSDEADLAEAECYNLAEYFDDHARKSSPISFSANLPLAQFVPDRLYGKYNDVMELGVYNNVFLVQTLIINSCIEPVDAVFCHDLWSLPVGCLTKELLGATLLYDSHEIGTYCFINPIAKEVAENNEKWMYEMCDTFITVSDACADYYKQVCPSQKPLVVTNAHRVLWDRPADLVSIKERCALDPHIPLAVYVGSLYAFTQVDRFIEAVALCRSNLHMAIIGDGGEIERFRELSASLNLIDKRVFFLGRVSYHKVFDTIYGADFGIIPNVQDTVNPVWAILSSKLFDYAQVELPIISDWAPEIQKIFDRFAIGQTVNFQQDPAEIAKLLDAFYARVKDGDFPSDERKRAKESLVWPKDVVDLILSRDKSLVADGQIMSTATD